MSVANCMRCGRIFNKTKQSFCNTCIDLQNALGSKILRYLKTRPNTTIKSLAEQFECSVQEIENLLVNSPLICAGHLILVNCHKCKSELSVKDRKGHLCMQCSNNLARQLGGPGNNGPTQKVS